MERLYQLFQENWTSLVRAFNFGAAQATGIPEVWWEDHDGDRSQFLAVVALTTQGTPQVDTFSILVTMDEGGYILARAGYMLDGDEVAGSGGLTEIDFMIDPEFGWIKLVMIFIGITQEIGTIGEVPC